MLKQKQKGKIANWGKLSQHSNLQNKFMHDVESTLGALISYRFLVNTACCGAPNKTFIQLNLFYLFLDCTAGRILFVRACESFGGFLPHSSRWLLHNSSPSMCPDRMFQPVTKANILFVSCCIQLSKNNIHWRKRHW